jgi:phosphonate transport system substrate-binding protein
MKRITYLFIALFVIASLAMAGCGPREAELGTEENPIIWALVPSGETDTVLSGFQSVADIIFEQTGLVVEPFVATEYAGVIEAMSADPPKAHMASLATFAYMLAAERGVAEAELVSLRRGSASYNGQIFARTDSGITSLADFAGKTFCGVDPLSTSGWIIPSFTLGAAGVDVNNDLDVVFAGSHDAAVSAVYNGECDGGSSFVDARSNLTEDYPDIMEAITIIEVSVDIPNDGVQYHPTVSREIRDQINNVLLTIHESEAGAEAIFQAYEWTELALRDDSFYEPFRQILEAAGVDISQYMK